MSEAISIDALLRLQMNQAEKDLEKFAKTVRPIDFKVNFKTFGKEVLNISTKGISSKLINTLDQAGDRLTEKLDKTFEKAGKIRFGGGLLGNLTNIITAPLQGLARGAFEGVGREVTRDLGKGISKGIEQELSKSIGGFDFIGKEISSRLTKELLIEIKPLVDVVEKSVKDIFGDRAFKVAQGAVLEQQAREKERQELEAIKGFQRERVRLGDKTGIRTGAEFNQALAKLKDKEVELKKVADSIRQKIDTEVDSKGGLEVKQEIEKINAEIETIAAKTDSLTQKISNARVDVFETIKELQDTTDEKVKQQLESQLDDLQKTIAETETAINKINKEGDLEKLTQQRTSLFSRLDNITQRAIERNQTAIDEFQKSDRALLAEFQKLDEIGKILTTLRDFGINIRFDELLSSLKVASGDVANLKVSLAKLNAANQTDTQKIQAFVNAKEVETNTELLAKIDEAIAQKYRDIEQRNQQIESLNQDISEATKQVQSLTTQAIAPGVRNQIVTEISQSIANLERSQADIQQEFNQIKNQTDDLSKQRKVLLIRAFEENKEALVNFKRLNKRLILAGAVPGNNVGRSSNSDIATAIEQEVRQTQQEVDKTLQQVYQLVLNQVAQISDVAIDPALIPRLKVAELPQGARGSFESATNTITVSPQAAQTLASGVLDPQFATTLVHELRHAIQSKFGQIDTINTDIDLLKATEDELNKLIHRIEKSVAGAVDLNSNDLTKLKAIEEDAYTFADRYTGQIVNNINQLVFGVSQQVEKSVDNNLDNLIEQIEQQVAQLGQIDLPNLPPIDKDAFLVVESVEQLEKILKEEFSAKGLTQIVKRLGLGSAKNKQQAIEQVTAAYKNDNFKTLELIARLGDDIKLKSAQTGLTSTLGTVDNEQSIREAFKHNQAVVRKIFQQLDQIDQENAQELSDFIRATAKEQIELIDQLQQQYQLTGKTAKSLSGTRSQFAAIFDFETIKNSLGKLESSLELASQAAPQETIAQIEKIEPELKSYLNSVKSLDKTSDVEAVRARLEASYKSLKTAKRLAYEAVEVSAIELAREPVKTVQLLKDSAIAKTKANTQLVVARASNQIANSVASTVENIIDDVKGKLVTTLQGVSRIALPEVQQKALPGTGALTVQTADTVKNILIRAAADVASLIKAGHSNLAAAEKVMLEINPLLKAAKIGLQVSAPVAATTALTTVSPEFAALANGLTGEVAQVLLPLVRHFTLFGFGAEKLAEAAAYLTVFGTAGQVGVKTIEGTAKKVGQAAFDATPQAFQNRLTPENIKAFDAIVAAKQKDIKALAASLSETVQNLKGTATPQTNQKLLTGYQQVTEEISQLEKFLSGSDVRVLKATSDRLKELRQIRDKLASVIDNSAKQVRTSLINLFDVQIEPLSQSNKNSLKLALTSYQQELVNYKQRIEQKILAGKFVDSDLQAGQELARRSQALSRTLINEPGYKRQAKQIAKATQELQSVVNNNLKQDTLQVSDDVINGILMGATSKLQDVGRNMGQDLLLGFRKELGIQSPSKKMMEQMEYIIAGLVQSQTEKQQLLEKIGRNLALGVEKGWQSGELNFAEQIEFKNLITRERNNLGAEPTKAYLAAFQKDLAEIEQGFSYWERIENQHLMQREARKAEAIASERRMHFGLEEPSFAYISKIQSKQFDSLSKSIIDGVTKGVDKSLKDVEQQGEKIGNRLLKGFRGNLGISSPSKVFFKQAQYVINGIEQGIDSTVNRVFKAGEKLGLSKVKGYQKAVSSISKINKRELTKEALVNAVGFTAGKAATIATGGIPGVGTVTELGASLLTRKAVTDIETTLEVFNRIVKDEANQLDSNLTLLTKVIKEAAEAARRKSQRTRKDLDQDATGFAIGNLAASTSQAVGGNIPLVGAATAIATTKSAIALRNQIIEQVDVNQLINAVSDGIVVAVGTNAAKIKNQGHRIGNEIIQGFKDELGIRSPAQRFIDEAKWIVKAIVIASEISYSKLKRTGRKLGENIVTGFEEATRNNRVARSLKEIERETQRAERAAANSIRVPIFNRIKGKAQETLTQVRKLGEQIKASLAVGLSRQSGTTIFQQLIAQSEILTARINANAAVANRAFMEGNRAAERTARNVNRQINSIGNQSETLFSRIRRLFRSSDPGNGFFDKLQAQLDKVGITAQRVKNTVKGLIALTVGSVFLGGIDQVARDVFDVGVRFEQLENRIDFAAGSAEKGAKAFAKVSNEARRLKVDIEQAVAGYASLAASTKNNDVLRGETDKIFRVVTQASRVMGSTAQQTESAFLAIRQMIDAGGTVQIEELKQLAESGNIQGVFGLAQKAIGAVDGELRKLISSGTIATEDFLPKFIDELDRATRSGLSASLRTTSAALQDLRNEYKLLQVALSKELNQTTSTTLDLIASALEITRNNLDKIIPVLKVTAALLAIALLPSALTLGKFLTGALVTGLKGGISLLVQTNTQLAATNLQLTLLASTSPKIAALIPIIGKLQVALKLAAVAAKAFLVFELITRVGKAWSDTANAGQDTRDALNGIRDAYKELQLELNKNNPQPELTKSIVDENRKRLLSDRDYFQKSADAGLKIAQKIPLIGNFFTTFEEAQLSRITAASGDAIIAAQKIIKDANLSLGLDVTDASTDDLQAYRTALTSTIDDLNDAASNAVDQGSLERINQEIDVARNRLKLYNDELKKRGDRELNLAKINITKEETVKAATEAELAAIAAIEEEVLRSGDFKQDIELVKLQAAETRLKTELEAERKQLAQIKELAATKGGIDPDTGKPRNSQQLEDFEKTEKRIIELTRSSIENRQALLRKETEQKLAEYDRYLEEVEGRRQEAEEQSIATEKERLIELQQLYNQDLISQQDFERLKVKSQKSRVKSQLDEEKRKLRELKKFTSQESEVRRKNDNDIKASKTKVLDLTLELLQQEKQATEDTINAIAESRDNVFSALENRLNRLQQIQQTEAQLVSDRATAEEKLGDLQVAKLRQALELRKQINSGDLNDNERRTALRQLRDLGVQGRTSEIALLNQIKDKEKEIAAQKLATLLKQQEFTQTQLEIENELLRISTKKAEIEAKKGLNEAEKQLNSAETAIATAETQAEFDQANKLYNLALDSYQIAQDEVNLTQQQANSLEDIINKKQENLELTQAIARAEAKAEGKEQKAEVEKELNAARESRDRRLGRNLDKYLSTQEKIDREVEGRRQKAEGRGQDFTEEDEQKLRRRLMKAEGRRQRAEGRRFATPKPFTITAPPEILEAIRTGKPITVPAIAPFKSTAPLQTTTIERNDPNSDRVLQVLKKIETKFKQPTVIKVQNDNQFVNQYQRSDTDEILRQMRSEQVDILNNIAQTYS